MSSTSTGPSGRKVHVERYRSGQVPSYVREATPLKVTVDASSSRPTQVTDSRIARLKNSVTSEPGERRRRYRHAEVIVEEEETAREPPRPRSTTTILIGELKDADSLSHSDGGKPIGEDMELDEDDQAARYERLKALSLAKERQTLQNQESDGITLDGSDSGDTDSSDSENQEEESEEEEEEDQAIRPSFISKEDRITLQREETELQKEEKSEIEAESARHERTLALVREQLLQEMEEQNQDEEDPENVSVSDLEEKDDPDEEYKLWKIRELKRLKRDYEESEAARLEREELERRRKMTDEEVIRELERERANNPESYLNKCRAKRKPGQRYYSTGSFYQEELKKFEHTHDWNACTGEDKWFDKSLNIPKPRKSKVKLFLEGDTTNKQNNPWFQSKPIGRIAEIQEEKSKIIPAKKRL